VFGSKTKTTPIDAMQHDPTGLPGPAVVPCVASRLVKRNYRDWPEDNGALLDLDLEERLFAQT